MTKFLFRVVDVLGGGLIYLAGGILAALAAVGGAALVALSIILTCAVPIFCIIAAWGILKYFGVL